MERHPKALRLAILQRVIPDYRVSLFERLASDPRLELELFVGEDLPGSKVRSARDLGTLRPRRMSTRFVRLPGRILPFHRDLVRALKTFGPDVILCEGESHFLGYLQAMWYRFRHDRRVGLVHWCFVGLPGADDSSGPLASLVKRWSRRHFDAFLLYSSYSKDRLVRLGPFEKKAFVATNVGDVAHFLGRSEALTLGPDDVRAELGLPERPTILYAGTLDSEKRPEVLLALAGELPNVNFVLVGSGPLLDVLRADARKRNLANIFLPGRVSDELPVYYRAADVMLLPGRGGIVISEALASGVPVLVHQADGTEYDLVRDGETGERISDGSVKSFRDALERMISDPARLARMGRRAQALARSELNQDAMVRSIIRAAEFARGARRPVRTG